MLGTTALVTLFPGQYYDAETGLNYNYFRSYNSAIGRYTQSDPIGLAGGFNLFSYVRGNPIGLVDPLGLLEWKGSFRIKGLGLGKLGGQTATFDLESECDIDGNRATVTVKGMQFTVGLSPLIGSDIEGRVTMIDGNIRVEPWALAGDFSIDSIGGQVFGKGLGKTNIYLGDAVSTDVSTEFGLDMGLQFGMEGTSYIESFKLTSCGCN